MSLKTWKKDFYPITALQAHKTLNLVELVEHSIAKWRGLRYKNLIDHGLIIGYHGLIIGFGGGVFDEKNRSLDIDAASCSLCRRFLDWKKEEYELDKDCIGCPIFESRGRVRCFETKRDDDLSPYGHWQRNHNPEPMIKALRKALKWAKEQE